MLLGEAADRQRFELFWSPYCAHRGGRGEARHAGVGAGRGAVRGAAHVAADEEREEHCARGQRGKTVRSRADVMQNGLGMGLSFAPHRQSCTSPGHSSCRNKEESRSDQVVDGRGVRLGLAAVLTGWTSADLQTGSTGGVSLLRRRNRCAGCRAGDAHRQSACGPRRSCRKGTRKER